MSGLDVLKVRLSTDKPLTDEEHNLLGDSLAFAVGSAPGWYSEKKTPTEIAFDLYPGWFAATHFEEYGWDAFFQSGLLENCGLFINEYGLELMDLNMVTEEVDDD